MIENDAPKNDITELLGAEIEKIRMAEKIGDMSVRILKAKRPRLVYKINRNPLLLMLQALPSRLSAFIIKLILK